MSLQDDIRVYRLCRQILRNPIYSSPQSVRLIGWLQSPNAAVSDVAGRCLMAIGRPALTDLLAHTTAAPGNVFPAAMWVLGAMDASEIVPHLRIWLMHPNEDVRTHAAASLASILVRERMANQRIDAADVARCEAILEPLAKTRPSARVHLRTMREGLR